MSVSFSIDVKPLFREKDREAMIQVGNFDLWDYADVAKWADGIVVRLEGGLMPCDAPWPTAQIDIFRNWIADGKQP
jgi:hypothetical protein